MYTVKNIFIRNSSLLYLCNFILTREGDDMFGMLTSCNHGTKCAAEPGVKRSEEARETLCVHSSGARLLV